MPVISERTGRVVRTEKGSRFKVGSSLSKGGSTFRSDYSTHTDSKGVTTTKAQREATTQTTTQTLQPQQAQPTTPTQTLEPTKSLTPTKTLASSYVYTAYNPTSSLFQSSQQKNTYSTPYLTRKGEIDYSNKGYDGKTIESDFKPKQSKLSKAWDYVTKKETGGEIVVTGRPGRETQTKTIYSGETKYQQDVEKVLREPIRKAIETQNVITFTPTFLLGSKKTREQVKRSSAPLTEIGSEMVIDTAKTPIRSAVIFGAGAGVGIASKILATSKVAMASFKTLGIVGITYGAVKSGQVLTSSEYTPTEKYRFIGRSTKDVVIGLTGYKVGTNSNFATNQQRNINRFLTQRQFKQEFSQLAKERGTFEFKPLKEETIISSKIATRNGQPIREITFKPMTERSFLVTDKQGAITGTRQAQLLPKPVDINYKPASLSEQAYKPLPSEVRGQTKLFNEVSIKPNVQILQKWNPQPQPKQIPLTQPKLAVQSIKLESGKTEVVVKEVGSTLNKFFTSKKGSSQFSSSLLDKTMSSFDKFAGDYYSLKPSSTIFDSGSGFASEMIYNPASITKGTAGFLIGGGRKAPSISSTIKPIAINRIVQNFSLKPSSALIQDRISIPKQAQAQEQLQKQMQEQVLIKQTIYKTTQITTPYEPTPFQPPTFTPPPPIPPTIIIPPIFPIFRGNIDGYRKQSFRIKVPKLQKTRKYKPTTFASLLNIKGKVKKTIGLTGLEIRPIRI